MLVSAGGRSITGSFSQVPFRLVWSVSPAGWWKLTMDELGSAESPIPLSTEMHPLSLRFYFLPLLPLLLLLHTLEPCFRSLRLGCLRPTLTHAHGLVPQYNRQAHLSATIARPPSPALDLASALIHHTRILAPCVSGFPRSAFPGSVATGCMRPMMFMPNRAAMLAFAER